MTEEERKEYGFHKLEVNQKIRVFKSMFNDKIFYKFQTVQKNYDGTSVKYYIPIQFKKNVEVENETDIIVKQFVENLRSNPKDSYNPIHFYQINKFEVVEDVEKMQRDALNEYNETIDENEQIYITDDFLD